MATDEGTERRQLAHINRARELEYLAQQERDDRRRRDMLELATAPTGAPSRRRTRASPKPRTI